MKIKIENIKCHSLVTAFRGSSSKKVVKDCVDTYFVQEYFILLDFLPYLFSFFIFPFKFHFFYSNGTFNFDFIFKLHYFILSFFLCFYFYFSCDQMC